MRQADGSDLLGANDPRSSSIGIIYVAPGDDRASVLEAILMQDKLGRKQVAVVLPDNSRAFQRSVDFDGLKNMRRGLKTEIIFVASGTLGPGPAEFARQRRFTVYTSLDNYRSALQAEPGNNGNGNAKKGLGLFNRKPKLVSNPKAPTPLESFDEPAPPPQPYIAPVIPLSAPPPAAVVPLHNDGALTRDDPVPVEPFVASNGVNAVDTDVGTDDDLAKPSPSEEQDADPYVAPVIPIPDDDEVEPVRSRSKSGPIPIPIALRQSGAATKPLNSSAQGENGTTSPARSGNTGKRAAVGAAAVGAGAAAAFAATGSAPAVGGGQPPTRGNAGGSGGGGGGGPRRRSTRQLLAILLAILTLLLLVGIVFASPPGQSLLGHISGSTVTATVTITPDHPTVSDSFVVTAVTGTPNPAAQQVQARILSYKSPSQSASAGATGSIAGRQATGSLTFINNNAFAVTFSSKVLTGASGVPVTFNGPITVPANPPILTVTGFAVNDGPAGDIQALDIVGQCCASGITVKNTTSFSGGQNPQPNSVITQHDINTASNNLISTIKPAAQTALQQKVQPNEQVVSGTLKCTTNVTANHNVGDVAKSVTVTGTATCTEEVYDQKGAVAIASNALKTETAKNPKYMGYALVGNVVTSTTSATVIDTKGTVSLVILAQGVWVYQFTDTILTGIKNKLAKQPQSAAQTILKNTPGVQSATISISSGNTMPDAANITITVVKIPGLTGSPTPTGSPSTTPTGSTPTSTPAITPTTGLGNGATVTPTVVLGGS